MTDVLIQMSMSLDGYIAGPNDSDVNGLGDGGERLHEWLFAGGGPPGEGLAPADQEVFDDLRSRTGAMLTGRRLYDITHGWQGTHPLGAIPAFVVSRDLPEQIPSGATPFTFVHDGIASAVAQAKEAAGDKDVHVIGGANTIRHLLDAGLADELRIDLIPVLLGGGIRLFDGLARKPVSLEQVRSTSSSAVTHIRYRVLP
ncbi:MAG: dihydrofolate reductase family protein [Streptosporangiaceae bacterium]